MADFNYFLLQIAREINSDELAEMKFLCEEEDDLPRGILEQIANPRELLNVLKKSGKIKPGEVMYLVSLLKRVRLVQLAERVIEMGKTSILLFSFIINDFRRWAWCGHEITWMLSSFILVYVVILVLL